MSGSPPSYQPTPSYAPTAGEVVRGWDEPLDRLPPDTRVVAIDGPAFLDWTGLTTAVVGAVERRGQRVTHISMTDYSRPWDEIESMTTTERLADDPNFAKLPEIGLIDLFKELPKFEPVGDELLVVTGPGAGLIDPEVIWYADLPKRHAEAAIAAGEGPNLGQRWGESGSLRRLLYIDWPLLDRHREAMAPRIDRWIDTQDHNGPTSLEGDGWRATMARLVGRPFRTLPTFNTTPWGGHWGQTQLGHGLDQPNTALGYELIAPESGVRIGNSECNVEVPFQTIGALHPQQLMGKAVTERLGTSFPIRFDYLDTVGGGHLSVHCHPRPGYMSDVFGWAYTQHETYYVMVGGTGRKIYLGVREGVDVDEFHRSAQDAADHGEPFDIERFVQVHPATPHQLFMVPAGTPHGSGEGNVVLEVSATPYLYSLRFYDWLRRDDGGRLRPVHVDHAFANLDTERAGPAVEDDLIQEPETLRSGAGWREEVIGSIPEMFFDVRRIVIDTDQPVADHTGDRFHVLNVVDGPGVVISTETGLTHDLNYAETIVVPAAVGAYRLERLGSEPVRVVKALVR